jgi:hypothetical protein
MFYMRRKRKKKHLDIEPLPIDVDNLVVDTTRRERFQIFEVLASMRKSLIVLLMFSGVLSIFFSLQLLMGAQLFMSSNFFILTAIGFIGVANITSGLLLLALE